MGTLDHQPVMAVQSVGILNSRGENQADEGAIPGAIFVMGYPRHGPPAISELMRSLGFWDNQWIGLRENLNRKP